MDNLLKRPVVMGMTQAFYPHLAGQKERSNSFAPTLPQSIPRFFTSHIDVVSACLGPIADLFYLSTAVTTINPLSK